VDIVGPSNLMTLLESIPPYWVPMKAVFRTWMADIDTEEGRRMLIERSPLTHVQKTASDRSRRQRSRSQAGLV
jgi:hypothetical protein